MFDVIVIPTDGSEYAEAAATRGFELARASDAAIHVLCVADTGLLGDLRIPGDGASATEALHEEATTFVDRLADSPAADGLDVTTTVTEGTAKSGIVEYAESVDADVIVMGTRGRGGVERLMLGSVAEHVVATSPIDVLVTRGG